MKKILKFTLLTTMIFLLAVSLVACGNKEKDKEDDKVTTTENTQNETALKYPNQSKTYNSLIKLYEGDAFKMVMSGQSEGSEMEIAIAKKGSNVYTSMKSGDDSLVVLVKDKKSYMLNPTEKQYIESEIEEGESESLLDDSIIPKEELDKLKDAQYKTGKEKINDKNYDYEEFTEDTDTVRYYFENNTLKYIKDNEELVEVKELTNDVPDSLFKIPSDYEKRV